MKRFFKSIFTRNSKLSVEEIIRKKTFLSFFFFFLFVTVAIVAWTKLLHEQKVSGVQPSLRKVLNVNERLFSKAFSNDHLVKTYPKSEAATRVRVNGNIGMGNDFDASQWKL